MNIDNINKILFKIIKSDDDFDSNIKLSLESYIIKDLGLNFLLNDSLGDFYHKISNELDIEILADDFIDVSFASDIDELENMDVSISDISEAIYKITTKKAKQEKCIWDNFKELLQDKSIEYWVDRLVNSKKMYLKSALGNWPNRNKLNFLAALSVIRETFPRNGEEYCDYIFTTSQISCGECIEISEESVRNKKLDRKISMLGGMPWTDEKHPWPSSYHNDVAIALEPIAQVNLRDVSEATGINLPNIIVQLWGEDYIRQIDINDLEHPDWTFPEHIGNGYGYCQEYEFSGKYISINELSVSCDTLDADYILSNTILNDYVYDDEGDIVNDWQNIDGNEEEFYKLYEIVQKIKTEIKGGILFPIPSNYGDAYSSYVQSKWRILIGGYNWSLYYRINNGEIEFNSTFSPQ